MEYLTRGTVRVINEVAEKTGFTDRYDLLNAVCEELVKRYPGAKLEYQLDRMKLSTTKDVLEAIDSMIEMNILY